MKANTLIETAESFHLAIVLPIENVQQAVLVVDYAKFPSIFGLDSTEMPLLVIGVENPGCPVETS